MRYFFLLCICDTLLGSVLQEHCDHNDQKFKPGWKDIFRMNQNELEAEIRKVSRDPTLDPRGKAYLIQNLMTRFLLYNLLFRYLVFTYFDPCIDCCSRWLAAQQKLPDSSATQDGKDEDIPGCSPAYRNVEQEIFGCEHYKRNCKVLAVCCKKLFTCRFCHDNVSDHTMDR